MWIQPNVHDQAGQGNSGIGKLMPADGQITQEAMVNKWHE